MLNQVILIEKTKFVYKLISSLLQEKGVKCYCLDEVHSFDYLINDLTPQLILVDANSFNGDWNTFWSSVEQAEFKNFQTILFGKDEELANHPHKEKFNYLLPKPLNVTELYEYLLSKVESH
jgi:DNA-binding response OmpR family regulator